MEIGGARMTEPMLYMFVYIVPALFLTIVGMTLFMYAHKEKTSRLVASSILCYALAFLLEAIRLGGTTEWNDILFKSVLFVTLLGVSLLLHSFYYINTKQKAFAWPVAPFIFYVPIVALFSYAFFEQRVIQLVTIDASLLQVEFLSVCVYAGYLILCMRLVMIGYKNAVIQQSKRMFQFIIVSMSGVIIAYGGWQLFMNEPRIVVSLQLLLIACSCSLLMALALIKYKMVRHFTQKYNQMLDLIPVMVAEFDEKLHLKEANALAFQNFPQLKEQGHFNAIWQTEGQAHQARKLLVKLEREGTAKAYAIKFKRNETEEIHFEIDATIVLDGYEKSYNFMIRDVTQVELQARQNYYLAYHDQLTGLYNRAYFVPEVMDALAGKQKFVLLLSDLNFFKQINDTYGHAVGDEVLKFTANLLKESVGEYCLLARLGGDEFIMCFSQIASEYHFKQRLEKIRLAFQTNYFVSGDILIEVMPSFGYAVYPEDGTHFEQLYHFADVKMYEDKRAIKAARQLE